MGNIFRLTKTSPKPRYASRRQSRSRRWSASAGQLVLGQRALAVTLVVLTGALVFLYLMMVNVRVTRGFAIQDLESRLSDLQKSQKQLERQAAELQSIQNIQAKVNMGNFIPTTDISYVNDSGFALSETR